MRSRMIVFLLSWYFVLMTGHWWVSCYQYLITVFHQSSEFIRLRSPLNTLPILFLLLVLASIVTKQCIVVARRNSYRFNLKSFSSLPACCLLAAILSSSVIYKAAHPLPTEFNRAIVEMSGVHCDLSGSIAALKASQESVQVFSFCVDTVHDPVELDLPLKNQVVRLSCYYCKRQFKPAESYRLVVRLKFKRPLLNFHDNWPWQRQWRLPWLVKGSVREVVSHKDLHGEQRKVSPPRQHALPAAIEQLARSFRNSTLYHLSDLQHGSSIAALLFGDRSGLADQHWQRLNNAGLSHLLVISGLHIGFIVVSLLLLTRFVFSFASRKSVAYISLIIASCCLVFYLNVINYGIPALRASLVAGFTLLLAVLRMRMLPSSWWLAALLLCSLIDPFGFVSKGFWLSFLGVGVLLTVCANRPHQRLGKALVLWRVQVGFLLGFTGVLLWNFDQAPVVSVISNLLAVPLISIILPLAMIAAVCACFITPFGLLLFKLVDVLLIGFWWIAEVSSQLPVIRFTHFEPLFYALLMFLAIPCLIHFRFPFAFALPPLILLGMIFGLKPSEQDVTINLLDVGQGQALILTSGTTESSDPTTLLVDAGPAYPRWDAGERVVLPALLKNRMTAPEIIIVSHHDNDHLGGFGAVFARFPGTRVLSGQADRLTGSRQCLPGPLEITDAMHIEVFWPPPLVLPGRASGHTSLAMSNTGFRRSDNNASCVVKINIGDLSIIIPGDIEADAQQALLQGLRRRNALHTLQADILVLPHHGSQNAFHAEFLSRVKPRLVLVSAGHGNAFGHPSKLFTEWFKHREIPLFNTGSMGAIEVRAITKEIESDAGKPVISPQVSAPTSRPVALKVRTASRPLTTFTIENTLQN